jgi:fructose transport system permease protein
VPGIGVGLGDQAVAEPAAGEGVVVRHGKAGAEHGGQFGGLLGVHDDLPVQLGPDLQPVGIFTALGLKYSGGASVFASSMPSILIWTGNYVDIGPYQLTTGVILMLVLYVVTSFALTRTAWGRHVYSTGDDPEAARLSGIKTRRVLLSVYLAAGVIYALAAWILIGRVGVASTNNLTNANLDSITAVVIGGTSLFGGRGAVLGTLLGALIVQTFQSGLNLVGVQSLYQVLAEGILVIAAVALDQWIRKVRG